MTSRDEILNAIRKFRPAGVTLPQPVTSAEQPANLVKTFCSAVDAVGGRVTRLKSSQDVSAALSADSRYTAGSVFSTYPTIQSKGISSDAQEILSGTDTLDLTLTTGSLAVAENGAVWVTDTDIDNRPLLFLCEHLFLMVNESTIVAQMHEAYSILQHRRFWDDPAALPRFGVFVSGPSKTADIEQSLVIGAQGPRSLTILLIER